MINAEQVERLQQMPQALRWVVAARVKTIGLSITPVLCGTWYASGQVKFDWRLAVLAALSAGAIQVGTNLWNDAADAESGTDTSERLGPPRMTALGLLGAAEVKAAAFSTFVLAALAGLPLVIAGGWPIVAIGMLSLLLGYAYSMGPIPLSHTPLGELIVLMFFGIIAVTGTAYALGAPFSLAGGLLGLTIGMPSSAVLLLNNHRDRSTDAVSGRRTLAILIGETGARLVYAALVLGSALCAVLLLAKTTVSIALAALLVCAGLALSWGVWRTPVSARINRFLPLTVLFQFGLFMALLVAGAI